MDMAITVFLGIFGGGALTTLVQFLITRHDQKNGKYSSIVTEIKHIQSDLDALREELGADRATNARIRILEFSDELTHNTKRSRESFNQVHEDIDKYKTYCNQHPAYENSRAEAAIANIERIYAKCLEDNDFL